MGILKECGMGPLLVLVSPCFRENVVVTCNIGSFLCSLLQKNIIDFFFGNQISKWRSFEERAIFGLLFTFFSHQGKVAKIPSARISLAYSGGTRIFFVGGIEGAKCDSDGAKIQKFAENG